MACISCHMLEPISTNGEAYARTAFNALAGGCEQIFIGFVLIWFLFIVYKMLLKSKLDFLQISKNLMVFSLIVLMLKNHHFYWEYIYNPIKDTTAQILALLVKATPNSAAPQNLNGMLETVENILGKVGDFSSHLSDNSSFIDRTSIKVVSFLLMIPFVFFWAIFAVYTVVYLFKLMVISSLSPLLIILAGFDLTRHYFVSGIKVILQGVLTAMIAAVAMGLTILSIEATLKCMKLTGEFLNVWEAFFKLFFLGMVAAMFQLKAPVIASNIIGAQDGAGPAAFIAGGITSMMVYSAKKAGNLSLWAGKKTVGALAVNAFDGVRSQLFKAGKSANDGETNAVKNRINESLTEKT